MKKLTLLALLALFSITLSCTDLREDDETIENIHAVDPDETGELDPGEEETGEEGGN